MTDTAACVARLRELPFVREARVLTRPQEGAPDGVLRLRTPEGEHRLAIELRRSNLDRIFAEHLARSLSASDVPRIVMAPSVGAPIGDLFEQHGISFVDPQGNCFLSLDGRYVARIQGRRGPPRAARERPLRGAGYQVLGALLADPALLSRTLQEIATAAGVSRQAPFDMLRRLVEEGFAVRTTRGLVWVEHRRPELFDRFFVGYRDTLRPRLLLGRWRTQAQDPPAVEHRLAELLGAVGAWRYGGPAGGHRLDGYFRGAETTVHLASLPDEFARRMKALPSTDGDLVALRIPGPFALAGPRGDTVHPLLVCAELLAQGTDRAYAAAARIRERFLA